MGESCESVIDVIAERKVRIPGWKAYEYTSVVGGIVVRGCITRDRVKGPLKGTPRYFTKEQNMTVIVTNEEIRDFKDISLTPQQNGGTVFKVEPFDVPEDMSRG